MKSPLKSTKQNYTAQQISRWLDEELNATAVATLKEQLAENEADQQLYEAMHTVDNRLKMAAQQSATPMAGFSQRFEARLQQHVERRQRRSQVWLASVALLLGTLLMAVLLVATTVDGVTGVSTLLQIEQVSQWQFWAINMADTAYSVANLGSVLLKANLILMSHPLFWVGVASVMVAAGVWAWSIQQLYRRQSLRLPLMA